MASIVVGGGCFWCLDAAYRALRGVTEVESGYAGGQDPAPNYDSVCTGQTGHAEVVRVEFDESVISEDVLLDAFFTMHDPTQLNRQGADVGTQYRSVMFADGAEQEARFRAARDRADQWWDGTIVTEIAELPPLFRAEEYHQDFFRKNPTQGYCMAVATPKVAAVRRRFAEYARTDD